MKNTLSMNRQLFNVKSLAPTGTSPEDLTEGQLGVYAVGSNSSIDPTTAYAALPSEVMLMMKFNGKLMYSLNPIQKTKIVNQIGKTYTGEVVNKWRTLIDYCKCISSVKLNINIEDMELIQRDGMTWTHRDFVVELAPEETECHCDAIDKPVYFNNVMTQALHNKVLSMNSPYYTSEVTLDVTGLSTYADQAALNTAVPSPTAGAMAIVTGSGVKAYSGTAWVVVATVAGLVTDVDAYVSMFKTINTDSNTTNDSAMLYFNLIGKVQGTGLYNDLEVNYVYPRGVRMNPALIINESVTSAFTETQSLAFEIGAGYDLRAEEFENMSNYTTLNHYPRLSDGIQSSNLVYQFENNTNYDTFTFEYGSRKSGLEDVFEGPDKMSCILLGSENGNGVHAKLLTMFKP